MQARTLFATGLKLDCEHEFWRPPCRPEGVREPRGKRRAGARSVPPPRRGPGARGVNEGPGPAPTQARGAVDGGVPRTGSARRAARPPAPPADPRRPLQPRRRGTRSEMISDSCCPPVSVYASPANTRTRALCPADPAAAEARVSLGCALTRTCFSENRGPGPSPPACGPECALRALSVAGGVRVFTPTPPYPTPPGFAQVHQGIGGKCRARSQQPGAAVYAGFLRLRKKRWRRRR